jgi:hypothetical protein
MDKRLIVVMVVLFLVLAACAGNTVDNDAREVYSGAAVYNGVGRFVDDEAGVVCWVYDRYKSGGISCLPLRDTLLDTGR